MRVLIVDDEPSILLFINTVLREAGYDTVLAQDGDDALNKRGTFDLLLTDVMMPRMRGEALAAKMRKRDPRVPVLYLTAYSDRLFERKLVLDEGEAFLEKPVTANALLEGIEMLLYGSRLPSGPSGEQLR
jgi:two-component system cell cycle sensor histidine kinase/response regulator CckA